MNYFRHTSENYLTRKSALLYTLFRELNSALLICQIFSCHHQILGSIGVSIPVCHAGDRGSIPRLGDFFSFPVHSFHLSKPRRTKHQLVSFFQNYEIIWKLATVIHSLTKCRYVVRDSKLPSFSVKRFCTILFHTHTCGVKITDTPYNQGPYTQTTENISINKKYHSNYGDKH